MRNRMIYGMILWSVAVIGYGQECIGLEQAKQMALQNSKQIQLSNKVVEQTQEKQREYRANFFPKISASANYLLSNSKVTYTLDPNEILASALSGLRKDLASLGVIPDESSWFLEQKPLTTKDYNFSLNNTLLLGISAKQPIYTGGKISSAYAMSKIGNEMAILNHTMTKANVLVQTEEAYWLCVKLEETLKATQAYNDVVEELVRILQNATEAQMKSRNDLLKAQQKLNEARLMSLHVKNGLTLAKMNLNRLIGLPPETEIQMTEPLECDWVEVPIDQTSLPNRYDLQILQKQALLKEEEIRLVRSDFLPNIGIQASYNYAKGVWVNGQPLLNNPGFSAIISLNIPLFNFGEGRRKIRGAKIEQEIALLKINEAEEMMQMEIKKNSNEWQEAMLKMEFAKQTLEQASENMRISKNKYEQGTILLADYLESQTAWKKAMTDYIEVKSECKLAQVRWKKAAGICLLPE